MRNGNFLWSSAKIPSGSKTEVSPAAAALCGVELNVNPGEVVGMLDVYLCCTNLPPLFDFPLSVCLLLYHSHSLLFFLFKLWLVLWDRGKQP